MPTNASAGLITALKASLADAAAFWCVTGIAETRSIASVTGAVADGAGAVSATTRVETRVSLASPKVRASSSSPSPLRLDYVSVSVAGVYAEGHVIAADTTLRTTDAALDATVLALAAAYTAARDSALTTALTAGPAADPPGVMPSATIAALAASLADGDAGWGVQSRTDVVLPSGRAVTVVLSSVTVTFAAVLASEPGARVPALVAYTATLNAAGALIDAWAVVNGSGLRVADPTLHAAIMLLADDWLAAQQTDIDESLA